MECEFLFNLLQTNDIIDHLKIIIIKTAFIYKWWLS